MTLTDEPFDTEVLGYPVKRLERVPIWVLANWKHPDCGLVICTISTEAPHELNWLMQHGFRYITTNVTYTRKIGPGTTFRDIALKPPRPLTKDNQYELVGGWRYTHDRYHTDPRIANEKADTFKDRWLQNCLAGRADAVFVAQTSGDDRGLTDDAAYVALRIDTNNEVRVDLIAVIDDESGGFGYGQRLLLAAMAHYQGCFVKRDFTGHTLTTITATTQVPNRSACRLYESLDFKVAGHEHVFHWMPA